MKETRKQSTQKIRGLWKNIASGIKDILHNHNMSNNQTNVRDMGDTHTPISRLNLTGLNKEQAKAEIDKLIEEKLEMVSHLQLNELKIDYKDRERQRANAAERINERRTRRKQKGSAAAETFVTENGVYSDYKSASIFDIIQPESLPFEEVPEADHIEGQVSIIEAIEASEKAAQLSNSTEFGDSFDIDPISKMNDEESSETGMPRDFPDDQEEKLSMQEGTYTFRNGVHINTTLDAAVDNVFVFYEKNKVNLVGLCQTTRHKTRDVLRGKILPAFTRGMERMNHKLTPLLQKIECKLELRQKAAVILLTLVKKEKIAADKMYLFIDFIDKRNEAFIRRIVDIKEKVCHRINQARDYAEHNKKKILIGFGIGVAATAMVTLTIGSMTAYEYIYNGKVLGTVKNQEDVYKTIDIIGDKLCYEYDAEITIDKDKDIRFNKVIAFNQEIDDKDDILNRLTYMRDMKANGHGIFVDGSIVAIMDSDKTAKELLKEIQDKFVKNDTNVQYKEVRFAENVAIKDVETKLGDIKKKDEVLEYMMTGAVEKKIHLVQSGETFSEIAKIYGLKQSELKVSNPDVIPEELHIGQEICLNQIVPLVTVQTVEVAQYKETIPFEIAYENTGSLYKNEQTVKSKGANGEKDVVAEIVRNNGNEVSRTEISATILAQPVSQVVLVGTKEPPPLIGTGSFIYPIRGTLTSRYGMRWGRLHSGIDLAAPIGTKIKASDGGKVIFAGYNGSLGYMVEIDHGGGRVTLYGHCSKLFVKKGDRVYQGQHIANVGNTGRSTGPHVHFEVHINGNTKNPLNYL